MLVSLKVLVFSVLTFALLKFHFSIENMENCAVLAVCVSDFLRDNSP